MWVNNSYPHLNHGLHGSKVASACSQLWTHGFLLTVLSGGGTFEERELILSENV